MLLDAPFVLEGNGIESSWRPEKSTAVSSAGRRGCARRWCIRATWSRSGCCASWGRSYATDYVTRFGFDKRALPQNLTLALGTLQATPLEMATGYAVFANGGFRVEPYFIDRIENAAGQVVWRAAPRVACEPCEQPVDLGGSGAVRTIRTRSLQTADALRGGRGAPAAGAARRARDQSAE